MIRLSRGVLVAFEGIDGAGKTTQARAFHDALTAAGVDVVLTKEPTNGPHGRRLRASARTGRLPADEELALFMADRREHVADELQPALDRGAVILIDRYYPSTVAYQGARGLDTDELLAANEQIAPRPDLLLIFDIDPALGLARVRGRGDVADLFEVPAALAEARRIFATLDGPHVLHLDARHPIADVSATIADALLRGPLADAPAAARAALTPLAEAAAPLAGRRRLEA